MPGIPTLCPLSCVTCNLGIIVPTLRKWGAQTGQVLCPGHTACHWHSTALHGACGRQTLGEGKSLRRPLRSFVCVIYNRWLTLRQTWVGRVSFRKMPPNAFAKSWIRIIKIRFQRLPAARRCPKHFPYIN